MAILAFFLAHWMLAGFAQTFFLHRYGSHKMFIMSKRWECFFYIFTFVTQGSSYLNPRAYAILHRLHHAHADKPEDPHSPVHSKNVMDMMLRTYRIYSDILYKRSEVGKQFDLNVPEWKTFDRIITGNVVYPLVFILLYLLFYIRFANRWWHWLLLPVQVVMGPVHGAIVNWCGHKYGYRNFDNPDRSTNALPVDFLTLGELFQNNHHHDPGNPNLAAKPHEFDPAYPVIQWLAKTRIIQMRPGNTSS